MKKLKTIYLIDDDDDFRFLIKEALVDAGITIEVLEADNGQALFEILQEDISDAVLLMDVNMPVMNGIEALQALKKVPKWSNLPVFVLSSSTDKSLALLVQNLGALRFYTKPAHFKEYIHLIKEVFSIAGNNPSEKYLSF